MMKSKFKISCLIITTVLIMLSNCVSARGFFREFGEWAGGKIGFGVVIDETNLNVRSGPGTQYDILEEVPYGAIVWLPNGAPNWDVGRGWVQVAADNGRRGFVSANLLETVRIYSIDTNYGSLYGIVNSDDSNLRMGASTKCPIVGVLHAGTKVMVRASAKGWYYVQAENWRCGWISGGYVDLTGRTNTTGGYEFF